jgi:hypothetical protein
MKRSLIAAIALALTSCATPTEYRADAAHPVRTITVAREVSEPKEMTFVGFSEMMGMGLAGGLGGAVGAGLTAGTTFSRGGEPAFQIGQSMRNAMIAEIRKSGKFAVKENGPADAELQLKVTAYGFYQAGMFARRVRPIIGLEGKLVRADGAVLWQHRRAVTQLTKETPAILPEKIRDDPAKGAEALRVAAGICARNAVASLRQ